MKRTLAVCLLLAAPLVAEKRESVFYPRQVRECAIANARQYDWAAAIRAGAIADAARWMRMSDEDLWKEVFGPRITRSHMVCSSGHCPACRRPVPMYDWQIDAWARPWKVRCPHCNEQFPKNDFAAFHRSGLDEHGVFDPTHADRSLLINTEHPNPSDPLHRFGVDDGEGYVEGGNRWRFIGAYLLYGQWTQRIEAGFRNLATAYTMTGNRAYAHKAAILLDRIADLWPSFDYATQGLVYERARYGGGRAGYVYYAIHSAYTALYLASAYDQIFDGIRDDAALVEFLRTKDPGKRRFADVQKNIEDRILRHVLDHPDRIATNYPGAERARARIRTVLEWPANRAQLRGELDELVRNGVAVDGLSGESGLAGYASIAPREIAYILAEYSRLDPELLPYLLQRNPKFRDTYRFHFDTWINHEYYPNAGDSGAFARKSGQYAGITFDGPVYSLLGRLARTTGDPLYAQMAWIGNGQRTAGLPHDIFAEDPSGYAAQVKAAVDRYGAWPATGSVNKQEWHIAILRHRTDPTSAVWLDYDSIPEAPIKSHYHFDAMNLGLFAKGLDLLPEFGYPAVQFGDWHTPQALWHKKTAAHNTVVVDGHNQAGGPAESTIWSAGGPVQVVRASSPAQITGSVYERTIAMVETGPAGYYVFDVFRVRGGKDHAKHTHTTFATPAVSGVQMAPSPPLYGKDVPMRNFQADMHPEPAWAVDWKIDDKYGYVKPPRDLHLRYTDLTCGAEAYTAESWTVANATSTTEYWIPTVIAHRHADSGDLESTFVSLLDPYEGKPQLGRITRLDREGDAEVRVEVELAGGLRDRLSSGPAGVTWERRDATGKVILTGRAATEVSRSH
jgi:oligo-alginate lyase